MDSNLLKTNSFDVFIDYKTVMRQSNPVDDPPGGGQPEPTSIA
jgi:hypothetical protein